MGSKTKLIFLSLLLAVCFGSSQTVLAASCQQKARALNYRATLLQAFQRSENDNYHSFRRQWSQRITYAGQWVPKDAQKTRDALYQYDALHKTTNDELNKQIVSYLPLQKHPLTCSNADSKKLATALATVKGDHDKKHLQGNALLQQDKQQETDFLKNNFQKSSAKMVKKLHQAKAKHPQPQYSTLTVKTI